MERRSYYNEGNPDDITCAALFIFFMRTCYNGIYSVNRSGKLAVTFGFGEAGKAAGRGTDSLQPQALAGRDYPEW